MSQKPELSYFGLQAYIGTTKHLGGLEATKELVELCHIGPDSYVLDVGCGAGATASYLARTFSCRVMGVDLRPAMVSLAEERAEQESVQERVEFRAADAQSLPFDDGLFDAVLCESVITFVEDKAQAVQELARVTRKGGYVGLNEEVWLKPPPSQEYHAFLERTWEIVHEVPQAETWGEMLAHAGLEDVQIRVYNADARREATQVRRYRIKDLAKMARRSLGLYLGNAEFRRYMKGRRRMPKRLFDYWGHAVVTGRKPL